MERQARKETLTSAFETAPAHFQMEDPVIDYIYHDLEPEDKLIFQYRTGYRGSPIIGIKELSKKVNLSPASVSNRAMMIAKKIRVNMGLK